MMEHAIRNARNSATWWGFIACLVGTTLLGLFSQEAHAQPGQPVQPIQPINMFDFDGDGVADTIVRDIVYNNEEPVRGAVRIRTITGEPLATYLSFEANDFFGFAVLALDDINGDGADEIAIAAPLAVDDGSRSGRVYVFSFGEEAPILTFEGGADEFFGAGLALAIDDGGDGVSDLLVRVDPLYQYPWDEGDDDNYRWRRFSLPGGLETDSGFESDLPSETNWNDIWASRPSIRSDINVDGVVDEGDRDFVISHLGDMSPEEYITIPGDLNEDGVIDALDLQIVTDDLGSTAAFAKGLPWKKIIGKAKGVGKTVGFFALVRAGACIAAIDAVAITCALYTNTDEEYAECLCLTLEDSDGISIGCRLSFLGYDLVGAVMDYIGCGVF